MIASQQVLELRSSYRAFRWDTGYFLVVALGTFAMAFFFFDFLSETPTESELYKYKNHALFSLINGVVTLCAIAMWLQMNHVLNRAKVQIECGRVYATIFDGRCNGVSLGIDEIQVIEVEKNREGQIVGLFLQHKEGTVELTAYPQLELALEAIQSWRPDGIVIRDKAPRLFREKVPILFVTSIVGLTTLATIHVRYLPIESSHPFSQMLLASSWIRLDQLRFVELSKRGDGDSRATLKVLYGKLLVFALLAFGMYLNALYW